VTELTSERFSRKRTSMARSEDRKTLVAIVLALYTLSTLSTFVFSSTIYLYTTRLVDSSITASEILMSVSVSGIIFSTCRRSLTDGSKPSLACQPYTYLFINLWLDGIGRRALSIKSTRFYAPSVSPLLDLWLYHGWLHRVLV